MMPSRGTWTKLRSGLTLGTQQVQQQGAAPELGQSQTLSTDWEKSVREALWRIPECSCGQKAGYKPTVLTGSPEGQLYPGLHKKLTGQQAEGGDSASLLCPHETPAGVLHPTLMTSTQEGHGSVGVDPEEDDKDDQRVTAKTG
ncbi:hypothetical protein DUI87_10886 [Hirundo rustica rustica]|uniref:Uncharacterized protein n=1 Tax=Hirundo rustica rustica TaxID=333673 RepID=A0A3M0KL35_HIRRU|nr:hypothetical protein DUI87_10886 [Hirundo rustica rustica]